MYQIKWRKYSWLSNDSSNNSEEDELEIQDETVTKENNNQEKKGVDRKSFLKIKESHEHWETEYLFVFYSAKEKGWLCKKCTEYGEGEYWRTKAVKMWEHPNRTFLKHQESISHVEAMKKWQEC